MSYWLLTCCTGSIGLGVCHMKDSFMTMPFMMNDFGLSRLGPSTETVTRSFLAFKSLIQVPLSRFSYCLGAFIWVLLQEAGV